MFYSLICLTQFQLCILSWRSARMKTIQLERNSATMHLSLKIVSSTPCHKGLAVGGGVSNSQYFNIYLSWRNFLRW